MDKLKFSMTQEDISQAFKWSRDTIETQAAEIKRLREALDILARLGNGGYYGTSEGNMIARAALDALPNIPKRIV